MNFVNSKFQNIFSDVKFVPLVTKPNNQEGEVKILKLSKQSTAKADSLVAQIATLFAGTTPSDFEVNDWSDIAILAPRKDWPMEIYQCFVNDKNLPGVQLHFDGVNDNCASPIRWLTSCLRYINNPADKREFAGILREIFGIKSQEIINYFKSDDSVICTNIDATFFRCAMKDFLHR